MAGERVGFGAMSVYWMAMQVVAEVVWVLTGECGWWWWWLLVQPLFPGESGVDQLVEIIKVGGGALGCGCVWGGDGDGDGDVGAGWGRGWWCGGNGIDGCVVCVGRCLGRRRARR